MNKTKAVLLVSFLLMFAAGAAFGLFVRRMQGPPPRTSSLTRQLNLTAAQQEQMREIWSQMRSSARGGTQGGEPRALLAQQRDQAVLALLTEAQRSQYEAIQQDCANKLEQLSQERRRNFEQAVERTKRILAPDQVAKYEELLKQRDHGGPGTSPGTRGSRRHHNAPASEPTIEQAPQAWAE